MSAPWLPPTAVPAPKPPAGTRATERTGVVVWVGAATAVVVATGRSTELGRLISRSVKSCDLCEGPDP